jgi:hypothetical protein
MVFLLLSNLKNDQFTPACWRQIKHQFRKKWFATLLKSFLEAPPKNLFPMVRGILYPKNMFTRTVSFKCISYPNLFQQLGFKTLKVACWKVARVILGILSCTRQRFQVGL